MARMSLDDILAKKPPVDRDKIAATTEEDLHRHAVEDGQEPDAGVSGFIADIPPALVRRQHNMTQQQFADALRIPVATLRNWEQNRVTMDPAAKALMRLAARVDLRATDAPTGFKRKHGPSPR